MGLSKLILNIALKIVDLLTCFVRTQPKRITFISLTQDHLCTDFLAISNQLQGRGWDLHYNLIVFKKNLWGDFQYFLNCLKQLVECKKSAIVIINDNNYVISNCKPANTKVLQVWHATGAIKQFGNQIKRQYPIQNYDAILCGSDYWKDIYAKAFGVQASQVYCTGMPRVDALLEKNENAIQAFYQKYPQCKNKKCILYAPTFRGNIIDGLKIDPLNLEAVENSLGDDWIILCKFHPLLENVQYQAKRAINVNHEDLYTLMHVSSCMISDYSSIVFDYSLLKKPIISYVPDLESYKATIGLNIDYNEFPGDICSNEKEVISAIEHLDSYDYENLEYFQKKYIVHTDGKNTERVVGLIESMTK